MGESQRKSETESQRVRVKQRVSETESERHSETGRVRQRQRLADKQGGSWVYLDGCLHRGTNSQAKVVVHSWAGAAGTKGPHANMRVGVLSVE